MAATKNLKSGLHALVWKEGPWFVAKCVEIEIASQGKTKSQSILNLQEAIELFLENEKTPLPKSLNNLEIFRLNPNIGYA